MLLGSASAIRLEVPVFRTTIDRNRVSTLDRNRISTFIITFISTVSALALAHASRPMNASAEPPPPGEARFGDSAWVAPNVYPDGSPSENGPRVNNPDKERGWE